MSKFEILCVTMKQEGFEKLSTMNIHSDVVFSNQTCFTDYKEMKFGNNVAKMISTETKGVGVNRNIGLLYASGEICLFADDDVCYYDDVEEKILKEFDQHTDADIIIFNFDSDSTERKQRVYNTTKKHKRFEKMPWACFKIAFKLDSVKKANIWFTTLYGGGAKYPSGEDSLWLKEAKRKGLVFYTSKEHIGTVSFEKSSWFTGYDERFYFGKGAFYACCNPNTYILWILYFSMRIKNPKIKYIDRIKWMLRGYKGYNENLNFSEYLNKYTELRGKNE